jgi:hypothetical protein
LWVLLARSQRAGTLPTRRLLAALFATGLVCRLAFALLTPTFYAPDEQAHFRYVRYLAEHRAFPVQTSRMNAASKDWEYYQPPLYYLALTPTYLVVNGLFHVDAVTVRAMRLFSILLWAVTLALALRFLDRLGVEDGFVRVAVAAMVALLPTYVFLSSTVNNDNLLIALGSVVLWRLPEPWSVRNALGLGVLVGLAVLTKFTAVVYVALLFLVPALGLLRRPPRAAAWAHAALARGVVALLAAPWLHRTLTVYGSLAAENVGNIRQSWSSASEAVLGTVTYMQDSFWAVSGVYNNISFNYPFWGRHVAYVAGLGLLIGFAFKRDRLLRSMPPDRTLAGALALGLVLNAALVLRFGLLYGQGQGRFLFPLLLPAALAVSTGLRVFSITDREDAALHFSGFFLTYGSSFTLYSLMVFPRGNVPWGPNG